MPPVDMADPTRPSLYARAKRAILRNPNPQAAPADPPPAQLDATPLADRKQLCTGEATGLCCAHYWPTGRLGAAYRGRLGDDIIMFKDEAEFQRLRHCTLTSPPRLLPYPAPAYCGRYEASDRPFDPLFEVAPPQEYELPATMMGGGLPPPDSIVNDIMERAKADAEARQTEVVGAVDALNQNKG